MKSNYQDHTDEALVDLSRMGDNEAEEHLIRRYKEVVRAKTRIYFIVGADEEDVAQEGMIGLFKAINSYDPERKASFRTFAELCINRQIMSAIKTANRQKHTPLNQSVSLSKPIGDAEESTLGETLKEPSQSDPEALLVGKETINSILSNDGGMLSEFEQFVWNERMKGKTYAQIAEMAGKSTKAIDNAVQRTKKKIMDYLKQ